MASRGGGDDPGCRAARSRVTLSRVGSEPRSQVGPDCGLLSGRQRFQVEEARIAKLKRPGSPDRHCR
eukprot:330747-Hanusia_phi.AAC.1